MTGCVLQELYRSAKMVGLSSPLRNIFRTFIFSKKLNIVLNMAKESNISTTNIDHCYIFFIVVIM